MPYSAVMKTTEENGEAVGLMGINFDKLSALNAEQFKGILLEELFHSRLNPVLSKYFDMEKVGGIPRLSSKFKPEYTQKNVPVEITQLQWAYQQAVPAIQNLIKAFPEKAGAYEYYLTF